MSVTDTIHCCYLADGILGESLGTAEGPLAAESSAPQQEGLSTVVLIKVPNCWTVA